MKTKMRIFRIENLEIYPDERQTYDDLKALINKTQDLSTIDDSSQTAETSKIIGRNKMEGKKGFIITVMRELEWFPDSIK